MNNISLQAPLLALEMAGKALRRQPATEDVSLEVEHVFSCEIEEWKQAYIERNFHPPILFRDIRELGGDEAHTAYGARVPVPGGVDLLVAGTSCVDNSNLNPSKIKRNVFGEVMVAHKRAKEVVNDDRLLGESGQTFFGMLAWVKKHKPTVILLENVCGALWELKRQMLTLVGYEAEFLRLDTKMYYIPHTRTRVYLLAVLKSDKYKAGDMAKAWVEQVRQLERPSSASLEAFLLPADDPRVTKIRAQLEADLEYKTRSRVDWEKCAIRHKQERESQLVGTKVGGGRRERDKEECERGEKKRKGGKRE
jgi:site-specific DNA-cytosine methylase